MFDNKGLKIYLMIKEGVKNSFAFWFGFKWFGIIVAVACWFSFY